MNLPFDCQLMYYKVGSHAVTSVFRKFEVWDALRHELRLWHFNHSQVCSKIYLSIYLLPSFSVLSFFSVENSSFCTRKVFFFANSSSPFLLHLFVGERELAAFYSFILVLTEINLVSQSQSTSLSSLH